MKETQGTKKKVTKGVKRLRSVRNMVMMALVCVLMLSAATYAWFTLSETAKVTNLTMNVGEVTGLQIAPDYNAGQATGDAGEFGSVLMYNQEYADATDTTKKITYQVNGDLLPATMIQTNNMHKPIYATDGTGMVTGTEALATGDWMYDKTGQYDIPYHAYKTHFYLKALGENDMTIRLADRTGTLTTAGVWNNGVSGTYILENGNDGDGFVGTDAIRISLKVGNQQLIYAPNNITAAQNGTVATTAEGYLPGTVQPVTEVQGSDGAFTSYGTINLEGGVETRVEMTIWIEGTDPDCANEMSLDNIISQLQFEKVN